MLIVTGQGLSKEKVKIRDLRNSQNKVCFVDVINGRCLCCRFFNIQNVFSMVPAVVNYAFDFCQALLVAPARKCNVHSTGSFCVYRKLAMTPRCWLKWQETIESNYFYSTCGHASACVVCGSNRARTSKTTFLRVGTCANVQLQNCPDC